MIFLKRQRRKRIRFYKMSREGLRVLAFAYKNKSSKVIEADKMPKLVFGGFYGIKDALRLEVKESVKKRLMPD